MTPKQKLSLVAAIATVLVLATPVDSNADVTGTNTTTAYNARILRCLSYYKCGYYINSLAAKLSRNGSWQVLSLRHICPLKTHTPKRTN
jgi:hypothetical protein